MNIIEIINIIQLILILISLILTINTTIKCKNNKSLGTWIILFITVYLLAKFKDEFLIININLDEEYMSSAIKEIYPIRLVITVIQIIIEILMIILPIKKLINNKKSDKISKGENQDVRND